MRPIPTWFERDLALIDPEYFVVYNDHYDYFEIKRKMSFSRKVEIPGSATADGRVLRKDQLLKVAMRNPTVAVFKILNDAALLNLRERKYIGRKFHRAFNETAFLDWIVRQNRDAKEKKEQLAAEMIAEGFMEMHRLERRHTVNGSVQSDPG